MALATCPGLAAAAPAVTLGDLPALVRQNNPRVQAAREFLRAAEWEEGTLRRSFYPHVKAEAGRETFRTGEENRRTEPFGTIGAEINLFRGGQDYYEGRVAQSQRRAAQAELEQTLRTELESTRNVFWALTFQREMERVLDEAVKTNASFLQAARRQIDSGLATSTDQLEFEIFHRQLEQDVARLKTDIERSEKDLFILTQSSALVLTPSQIPHDHDAPLLTEAVSPASHPSVVALEASRAGEKAQSRAQARFWTPKLDLYSDYSLHTFREREFEERRDRDETVIGGKISLPIFDGMASNAAAHAAALRAEGYEKNRAHAERAIAMDVDLAKHELSRLHDLVHAAEESVGLGDRYLKATVSEYRRGVKNSPDLISALEKNVEIKERYAAIRRDYQMVKSQLLALLGK